MLNKSRKLKVDTDNCRTGLMCVSYSLIMADRGISVKTDWTLSHSWWNWCSLTLFWVDLIAVGVLKTKDTLKTTKCIFLLTFSECNHLLGPDGEVLGLPADDQWPSGCRMVQIQPVALSFSVFFNSIFWALCLYCDTTAEETGNMGRESGGRHAPNKAEIRTQSLDQYVDDSSLCTQKSGLTTEPNCRPACGFFTVCHSPISHPLSYLPLIKAKSPKNKA